MPTPIGHTIAGLAFYFVKRWTFIRRNYLLILASVFAANAPDIDFLFGYVIGNPNKYHHQFTHSITFALLFGFFMAGLFGLQNGKKIVKRGFFFSALIFLHLGLDFVTLDTSAPFGEMLFWPFSVRYYYSPVVIFSDVHRASTSGEFFASLFSMHNLRTIFIETAILTPILILIMILRKRENKQ